MALRPVRKGARELVDEADGLELVRSPDAGVAEVARCDQIVQVVGAALAVLRDVVARGRERKAHDVAPPIRAAETVAIAGASARVDELGPRRISTFEAQPMSGEHRSSDDRDAALTTPGVIPGEHFSLEARREASARRQASEASRWGDAHAPRMVGEPLPIVNPVAKRPGAAETVVGGTPIGRVGGIPGLNQEASHELYQLGRRDGCHMLNRRGSLVPGSDAQFGPV
jgi:hypothetical protein